MSKTKICLTAWSDAGGRPVNEDSFGICKDLAADKWRFATGRKVSLGERGALLIVCDGMGGANAGEVASALAVEAVKACFAPERLTDIVSDEAARECINVAIRFADRQIAKAAAADSALAGMGSTIVLAWLLGDRVHVGWCGDSRAYRYNPALGLQRLSHDHSFVQSLVDDGRLTEDLARQHPESNIITRCLGGGQTEATPEVHTFPLYRHDVVLLCSDGFWGVMTDREIEVVLEENFSDIRTCRDVLLAESEQKGWTDNVTLALCRVASGGVRAPQTATVMPLKTAAAALIAFGLLLAVPIGWFTLKKNDQPEIVMPLQSQPFPQKEIDTTPPLPAKEEPSITPQSSRNSQSDIPTIRQDSLKEIEKKEREIHIDEDTSKSFSPLSSNHE
jgi:protein phosphatase